jgi:exosortase E/protease (VPEID-CTERM system)
LLHTAAFGVFFELTRLIAEMPPHTTHLSAPQLLGWATLGSVALAFWLFALAPIRLWLRLARQEYVRLLAAFAAGLASWAAALLIQRSWSYLAAGTLWFTHSVTRFFYTTVVYDPDQRIVGTPAFQIEIAYSCSGYEGLALIICFLGAYLWLFRRDLRFPHALLLLPIGMAAMWIANGLRIFALIAIGTSFSPEAALNGFHSQAGWIAFTAIALGLVAVTHRMRFFAAVPADHSPAASACLATALLIPFIVLMATAMLTQALLASDLDRFYPLRVAAAALALWYFRKLYSGLGWTWSWQAVGMGALVFLLWMTLNPTADSGGSGLGEELAELAPWSAAAWLVFRVLGSVVTVPLVEELVFRGYLLRKLIAQDFEQVPLSRFTWWSFLSSSMLFGLLHSSWFAGTLAGMGYALALYRRGQIGDAVAAHVTTNALIAAWVLAWQDWSLWTS